MGVHFQSVRARDDPRRHGVPVENRSATRRDDGAGRKRKSKNNYE